MQFLLFQYFKSYFNQNDDDFRIDVFSSFLYINVDLVQIFLLYFHFKRVKKSRWKESKTIGVRQNGLTITIYTEYRRKPT